MRNILRSTISILALIGFCAPTLASGATELNVPYTMQAPYSQWGTQPWEDACEEAVTVMIDRFYRGVRDERLSQALATNLMQHVVNLERLHFGFDKDTNAEQIVTIINNYFPWEAEVVHDPTIEMLEKEIDAERPVIVPIWGKALKNPYFKNGGPDYHTVVIKGYDRETREFITHEPGNGAGLDYRYSYATLMDAMHDFLPGNNTKNGQKVAVFTKPQVWDSAWIDADNDGLSKAEELKHGTLLWIQDTDQDGYMDGAEVLAGFSPTLDEQELPSGSLVKIAHDPKVYLIEYGKKRHIPDEKTFLSYGWKWTDIHVVSKKFLGSLSEGERVTL